MAERPGLLAPFGSGETSASGRKAHDCLLGRRRRPARTDTALGWLVTDTPTGPSLEPLSEKRE